MICPQCATRNDVGSQRCRACRRPFTHDAYQALTPARQSTSRRQQPLTQTENAAWDVPIYGSQFATPRPTPRSGQVVTPRGSRRRRGVGCLLVFGLVCIMVVGLLVVALLASTYVVKPMVRDAAVSDLQRGVRDEINAQIEAQIADAPTGELVITDDEINQRLASSGDLGPIDTVTITIEPDVITIDLSAYGLHGQYESVIRAQNGSVVLDRGALSGPLGYVIPSDELAAATNVEIAAALSDAGYRVESATMHDGAIALLVSR